MEIPKALTECFDDTFMQSLRGMLKRKTIKAKKSNKVYKECFIARHRRLHGIKADIIVEECTSFASASKYREYGRTAVLNFANPVQPGGKVKIGAMAQEECLCRSSNLFACISDEKVKEDFYNYHIRNKNAMNSDRLIYTKNVTVFKSDDDIPVWLDRKEWFNVDVITCAAPYLGEIEWIDGKELKRIIKNRIRNVFESAIDNKVSVLILGAFGCGTFFNPPELVAEAFHEIIIEECYRDFFRKIIFAVKTGDKKGQYNFKVFKAEFGQCSKLNNFIGKNFSIFGDSISTLEGYNPNGYDVFYTKDVAKQQNINSSTDTWWGMVIDYLGGNLLMNNSWSGCRVTQDKRAASQSTAGCSLVRTGNLHVKDKIPDCIIVYMGFNDWGCGVLVENQDTRKLDLNEAEFADAYTLMLRRIKSNYPMADVYCCTLCKTCMDMDSSFIFPESFGGVHIKKYNEAIRKACTNESCKLLDLYSCDIPYDTIDGTHPTKDGMKTLAGVVARMILRQ